MNYGITADYGQKSLLYSKLYLRHQVNLSGLVADTQYFYQVVSKDSAGKVYTAEPFTFKTTPQTPPVISNVRATNITASSAAIKWNTNEPSDSQVEYGLTASYGSLTTINTSKVTSHTQKLFSLKANTLYHYRVLSRDPSGNLAISGDYTFTTLASPDTTAPVISGVSANTTSDAVSISWQTNELSDSQVEYGLDTNYGSLTFLSTVLVTSHVQLLCVSCTDGLKSGTLYYYRVRSKDAAGNLAVSGNYTFKTLSSSARTTLSLTGTVLGAVSGRVRSATDDVAALTFTVGAGHDATINKITLTFQGSAVSNGTVILARLIDPNTGSDWSGVGRASCTTYRNNSCKATFSFTTIPTITAGTSKTVRLRIDSSAFSDAPNGSDSLTVSVTSANDVDWGDGTTTSGLGLDPSVIPFKIAAVSYE